MQTSANQREAQTLLWIGDRHSIDFRDAYQYCEDHASQIAWRADVASALDRGAHGVRWIVLAQTCRQPPALVTLQDLDAAYPGSSRLNLLGVLCEAITQTKLEGFDRGRHPWHRWNQLLPVGWAMRMETRIAKAF